MAFWKRQTPVGSGPKELPIPSAAFDGDANEVFRA